MDEEGSIISHEKIDQYRKNMDLLRGLSPIELTFLLKSSGSWDERSKSSPFVDSIVKMGERWVLHKKESKERRKAEGGRVKKALISSVKSRFPSSKDFNYRMEVPSSYINKIFSNSPHKKARDNWWTTFWAFIGSFIGIASIGLLYQYGLADKGYPVFFPALGATSVLFYSLTDLPGAQPRNAFVGQVVGTFVSVAIFQLVGQIPWLAGALSVSLTVAILDFINCQHPPAGALALAFIVTPSFHSLLYLYIPLALLGTSMLFITAVLIENIPKFRKYPMSWW